MSSRQIVRNVRGQEAKDFIRALESLSRSRNRWDIFRDWTEMAACALYNGIHQDPKVEEQYLAIAKRYNADELKTLCEMLAIATSALYEDPRDFMGEVYEGAMLANENHGQFFTPYDVSKMMAQLSVTAEDIPRGKIITISEPACGAGGMIIAIIEVLKSFDVNYAADVFVEARDIDATCARMCFIQMSLLGISGVVICGNTITLETYWTWPTAAYELNLVGPRLAAQRRREEEGGVEPPKQIKIGPQIGLFEEVSA
jgi:hypothetical protein